MAEVLQVKRRTETGSRAARRLRRQGQIPAILYGHGEENVPLTLSAAEVQAAVRHGARQVDLEGDLQEKALIRELQWDTWGLEILHVDLQRVHAGERVTLEVAIHLRGDAPGAREGGHVEQLLHQVEVECSATEVPEELIVRINQLQLGQTLTVQDLAVPPGVKVLADPDTPVVQCVAAEEVSEEELEAPSAAPTEPELIGRKKKEEEQED